METELKRKLFGAITKGKLNLTHREIYTDTHSHKHAHLVHTQVDTQTQTHKCKCTKRLNSLAITSESCAQLAEPGICALSRLYELCKQRSWSQTTNSQENRPFLPASGVGTRSPTWTIVVSWQKALNLYPSECQVPHHSWVGWWSWWEADEEKPDEMLPQWGLNL